MAKSVSTEAVPANRTSTEGSVHSALAFALALHEPEHSALPWHFADGGLSSPLHFGATTATEQPPVQSPEHATLAFAPTSHEPRHSPLHVPVQEPRQVFPGPLFEQPAEQSPSHVPWQTPSHFTARLAEPSHVPVRSALHLPEISPGSQRSSEAKTRKPDPASTSPPAPSLLVAPTREKSAQRALEPRARRPRGTPPPSRRRRAKGRCLSRWPLPLT